MIKYHWHWISWVWGVAFAGFCKILTFTHFLPVLLTAWQQLHFPCQAAGSGKVLTLRSLFHIMRRLWCHIFTNELQPPLGICKNKTDIWGVSIIVKVFTNFKFPMHKLWGLEKIIIQGYCDHQALCVVWPVNQMSWKKFQWYWPQGWQQTYVKHFYIFLRPFLYHFFFHTG